MGTSAAVKHIQKLGTVVKIVEGEYGMNRSQSEAMVDHRTECIPLRSGLSFRYTRDFTHLMFNYERKLHHGGAVLWIKVDKLLSTFARVR
jgi:hypothetical protein